MIQLDVRELLNIEHLRVENFQGLQGKLLKGVSTDSRKIVPGEVFFAIRGDKFDGHDFLSEAAQRGCLAAVVEDRPIPSKEGAKDLPLLVVKNSAKSLGDFARLYRQKFDIPVIAVTGSNGKTTTKEMIAEVLREKFTVLKTEGNLNNHIGVPQTLFRLEKKHDVAVIEVGTNHSGEIDYLCRVAHPTHGLITNVGRAHLEFFGSLDGVAEAKGELFEWLGKRGFGFVNADDNRVVEKARRLRRKLTYGFETKRASVKGRFLGLSDRVQPRFSFGGRSLSKPVSVQLKIPGKHTAGNALAAAAVGIHFGVSPRSIKSALENYRSEKSRMEVVKIKGVTILDDTYNANPDSVQAALQTLAEMKCKGKKIVVLGDMLELGSAAVEEHQAVGTEVKRLGFEYLLTYGAGAAAIVETAGAAYGFHYEEKATLTAYLEELVMPSDVVLVKGSRGMKMEEVVIHLTDHLRSRR
jgi:UDP-N-acetylmuramoyl-tripeptide--D-alanyl-D-alanine ligase